MAYGALMIVWPYPAEYERMCYPLLPFAVLFAVLGMRHLAPRIDPRIAAAVPLLATATAIAPFALLVQSRLASPPADQALRPYTRSAAWFEPHPAGAPHHDETGVAHRLSSS